MLVILFSRVCSASLFFFNDTATTEIYTLSLHDALPICPGPLARPRTSPNHRHPPTRRPRSEEHTSELQSLRHLVCRLLLEKKNQLCCPKTPASRCVIFYRHSTSRRHI